MDTSKPLYDFLNKFDNLTEKEFNEIFLPYMKVRKIDKREILVRAGEIENHINFIKGIIRKYYKKGNEEFNTQISLEGHIIHCQESFHGRVPSEYFVEAIEPSVIVSFSYDDLEKIFGHSIKMERLGRKIITKTMVMKDKWRMQLVKLNPRERFLDFVTKNPELMQRVPQKFLASYLNIKAETFSRFKHLIKGHFKIV
jgi:CRP-like cAMP-binding protein